MKSNLLKSVLSLTALLIIVITAAFTGACSDKTTHEEVFDDGVTKVLFIGNSFTYYSDIPALFGEIATAAGLSVEVNSVTNGSHTLEKFADPSDEFGKIVDEKLKAADDYDAVVLQEHSTRPITNYAAFLEGAETLQARINNTQKNCRIFLYSTWGYEDGAAARNITVSEMEARIRAAYDKAATAMGVNVSYVGKAFSAVSENYPELNLYFTDNKHPSYTGAFLSACVHVATVLGKDPRLSDYTGELDEDTADILKQAAYDAVN